CILFFFQAEDGIRDKLVTGVQTCALPISCSLMPYTSGANDLTEGPFLGGYMVIAEPHASMTMTGRACGLPLGNLPSDERQRAYRSEERRVGKEWGCRWGVGG